MTSTSGNNNKSTAETASSIKVLLKKAENNITTDTLKQNNNASIIQLTVSEKEDATCLEDLRRIFVQCILLQELTWERDSTFNNTEAAIQDKLWLAKLKYNSFLQSQYSNYVQQLCRRIRIGKKYALRCLSGLLFSPSYSTTSTNQHYNIVHHVWIQAVDSLCSSSEDDALYQMFIDEFVKPYPDMIYITVASIKLLALQHHTQKKKLNSSIEHLIRLLEQIPIISSQAQLDDDSTFMFMLSSTNDNSGSDAHKEDPTSSDEEDDDEEDDEQGQDDDDDDSKEVEEEEGNDKTTKTNKEKQRKRNKKGTAAKLVSGHKRIVEEAWLAILRLFQNIPIQCHKRILTHLSDTILPYVHHPLRFADYLSNSYNNFCGTTTILPCLALHGLYVLMTQHDFQQENYYACLYRLIRPAIFYAKFRTRFMNLLLKSLSPQQQKLPAYLVAAFLKKMCRCALTCPPSGALFVLAFSSNLLRQHKSCACLVHRGKEELTMEDPYNANTSDPMEARALESSLWELSALEKHYHPAVSALAKACGKEDSMTTLPYDMEDFLLHTYKSLFEEELSQQLKKQQGKKRKAVSLTFVEPDTLFPEGDALHDILNVHV